MKIIKMFTIFFMCIIFFSCDDMAQLKCKHKKTKCINSQTYTLDNNIKCNNMYDMCVANTYRKANAYHHKSARKRYMQHAQQHMQRAEQQQEKTILKKLVEQNKLLSLQLKEIQADKNRRKK